ncbi:MAG: HupE/UreJ family protein [Mesorhizobium sp.]|uniref:HupE/UreJ family protein n=1 Tax=Mesorhizobium sp. TaxID=1871066 RepID=UPI0011FD6B89|nr:HupE/UreJ family protein [Mesorhizobium sp.]TIR04261.1 MAG: HupE/UreJ family protein [Mesorhizobium sp.]
MKRSASAILLSVGAAVPAYAHAGSNSPTSFVAGLLHPVSGLDHVAVMIAIGAWSAAKGGRAIWAWPLAFMSIMLIGGAVGILHVPLPLAESGIIASVLSLGLLLVLAVDLPVSAGAAVVSVFALIHGHAHGTEIPEDVSGILYLVGLSAATAVLLSIGIAALRVVDQTSGRRIVRFFGAGCTTLGLSLLSSLL